MQSPLQEATAGQAPTHVVRHGGGKAEGKWIIALAIALAIALLSEWPTEFPIHLRIAFGCVVEALWMSFS